MGNKWAPVVGYEGLYEVSDDGLIRSLYREGVYMARWGLANMRFPAKQLRISITRNGYCYVCLSKVGVPKKHLIHRLVMAAFAGPNDLDVNHIDGNKKNNSITNLEYCTTSENHRHCIDVLGKRRGSLAGNAKLKEADIASIRADGRLLREIAADHGVTLQAIHHVKRRKNWAHVA